MKIYDISQEVFSSEVYLGDPIPKREVLCSIENGDVCNLTAFNICLLVIGVFIDCYFLLKLNNLSMRIKKLLKLMRGV